MEKTGGWVQGDWERALATQDPEQIANQMKKVDSLKGKDAILNILKQEAVLKQKPQLLLRLFRLFPENEKLRLSSITVIAAQTFKKELDLLSRDEKEAWIKTAIETEDDEAFSNVLDTGWQPTKEWLHRELLRLSEENRASLARLLAEKSPQFLCNSFTEFKLVDPKTIEQVVEKLISSSCWEKEASFSKAFSKMGIVDREICLQAANYAAHQDPSIFDHLHGYELTEKELRSILKIVAEQQPKVFLDNLSRFAGDEDQLWVDELLSSVIQEKENFEYFIQKPKKTPYVQDKIALLTKHLPPESRAYLFDNLLECDLVNKKTYFEVVKNCGPEEVQTVLKSLPEDLAKKIDRLLSLNLRADERKEGLKSLLFFIGAGPERIPDFDFLCDCFYQIASLNKDLQEFTGKIFSEFYPTPDSVLSPEKKIELQEWLTDFTKANGKVKERFFLGILGAITKDPNLSSLERRELYQEILKTESPIYSPRILTHPHEYDLSEEDLKKSLKILARYYPKLFLDHLSRFAGDNDQKFVDELLLIATKHKGNFLHLLTQKEKTPYVQEKLLFLARNEPDKLKVLFENLNLLNLKDDELHQIINKIIYKSPHNYSEFEALTHLDSLYPTAPQKLELIRVILSGKGVSQDLSRQLAPLFYALFKENEKEKFSKLISFAEKVFSKEGPEVKKLVGQLSALNSRSLVLALEVLLYFSPESSWATTDLKELTELTRFFSMLKSHGKSFKDKLISIPLLKALKEVNKSRRLLPLEKLQFYNGILAGKHVLRDFKYLQALIQVEAWEVLEKELVQKKEGPFDFAPQMGLLLLKTLKIEESALPKYVETFGKDRNPGALLLYISSLQSEGLLESQTIKPLEKEKIFQSLKEFVELVLQGKFEESRYDLSKSEHLRTLFEADPKKLEIWRTLSKPTTLEKGLTLSITDDREDLLLSGTEIIGSCQAVDGTPSLTKCLLGAVINGKTQMVCIKDDQGRLVARRLLRLLWDPIAKLPVLLVDPLHTNRQSTKQLDAALLKRAKEKAKELGVACVVQGEISEVPYPRTLQGLKERAPYEYFDSLPQTERVASGESVHTFKELMEI